MNSRKRAVAKGEKVRPLSATPGQRRKQAQAVLVALAREFPGAITALLHENPLQLLIATILSAQCTDERVNKVTPGLFRKYRNARDFAAASTEELEKDIRSTGFFRSKAKNIIACSRTLVERHDGEVPPDMEALVTLPGVGRKTANVVLGQAFGIASGIAVDTHVHRIARRLGWSEADQSERIEQDLMALFPKKDWIAVGSVLILHGRRTCAARKPLCPSCVVHTLCPSATLSAAEHR
jgi:endonuclease III